MSDSLSNKGWARIQLEFLWLSRLKEAHQSFFAAAAKSYEALKEQEQSLLSSLDSAFAAKRAAQLEAAALGEYTRVLKIFTRLTAEGILPPTD